MAIHSSTLAWEISQTEDTLENESLHNFNCRLKKPVLETFTVSKITTGALRNLGQSVHFISVLHLAGI